LLGLGDGTFLLPASYNAGLDTRSVAVGDFNGDAWPDLAVANWEANTTTVLFNDGIWATRTWVGPATGGDWSNPANWVPAGVPTADDTVLISGSSVSLSNSASIGELHLAGGATLTLAVAGNHVLRTTTLSIGGSAKLDLNDNDLILDYSGTSQLGAVQALINSARAGGAWTGNGITSTAAREAWPYQNTTLGAMEATDYKSVYGESATFDGEAIDNDAVLVKYTYYGDTNFNGRVNFDDYVRIDNGFNTHRAGWLNGDFDGNGRIDFDDYVLLDLAFNTQATAL
jgi:hypothetical protein